MRVLSLKIKIYAPWVHSLKEKRMEVKSLVQKIKNKFNMSVAEVAEQDMHQTIIIGIAAVCADSLQADSYAENVLRFIENATQGEMIQVDKDVL